MEKLYNVDLDFFRIFALFLVALIATYLDRYVGITAFVCVTSILLLIIHYQSKNRQGKPR